MVGSNVRHLTLADAKCMHEWVQQARAIARSVSLAVTAQEDGSANFDNSPSERWWAALDVVESKVAAVRDMLSNRRDAPPVDWFTSLNVVEALGAAAWHASGSAGDRLDSGEFQHVLGVVVESLDDLAGECADVCTQLDGQFA